MKTHLIFTLLLFLSISSFGQIENYGGSASVKIRNSNGETSWITVVTAAFEGCYSEDDAEKKLNNLLKREMGYSSEMITRPSYETEEFRGNVEGSASVRVMKKDGSSSRIIIAEIGRFDPKGIFAAKRKLLSNLKNQMRYDEIFAEGVEFDL